MRLRNCPACRAILKEDQVMASDGACPYCKQQLSPDLFGPPDGVQGRSFKPAFTTSSSSQTEPSDPYAPPTFGQPLARRAGAVPAEVGAKILFAFSLFFELLPLISLLVLTVWVPGSILIQAVVAAKPDEIDFLTQVRIGNLIEFAFGPIYAGGIITALAGRMERTKTTYRQAIQAGLHNWGQLLGARLIAGFIIFVGLLAFVVPGIILAIRYILVDEAVVLEGSGPFQSRLRSAMLTRGKGFPIFFASLFALTYLLLASLLIGTVQEALGLDANPFASIIAHCLSVVVSTYFTCLFFIFYWESREEAMLAEMKTPVEFEFDD